MRTAVRLTFKERQTLNDAILRCIGAPAASWGVQVLRYEIRDIQAPTSVREAMDKQVHDRAAIAIGIVETYSFIRRKRSVESAP